MEVYIAQRDKEKDLYTQLQRESVGVLERMSGKIWTDFNVHDPGVTILDVLNYGLTELDFKLGFSLEDYLTGPMKPFSPEDFGFFLPFRVFPVSPVTVDDYRRLFLMNVTALENVWIEVDRCTGEYTICPEVFSFSGEVARESIEKQLRQLFESNRNLCESLREIRFVDPEEVHLVADVRIEPGMDPTDVLVELFYTAHVYLTRSVEYHTTEERVAAGVPPDEWLDGPNATEMQISVVPDDVVRTETELYHLLCGVKGVLAVYSCYIKNAAGNVVNFFEKPYRLFVPENGSELALDLTVKVGEMPARIKPERFVAGYQAKCLSAGNILKSEREKVFAVAYPSGQNHVFDHDTILEDFPDCYGVNDNGLPAYAPEERKAQRRQLMAYLKLFDFLFLRGMTEVLKLPEWMRLEYVGQIRVLATDMSDPDFYIHTEQENEVWYCQRKVLCEKNWLSDMLEAMYGDDSDPVWVNEYNYYGDTAEVKAAQRIAFLQRVPLWGKRRFCACNLTGGQDAENIPGVKAYLSVLLNWQYDEGKTVGNIFPSYNLNFISDEEYEQELKRMLKSDLIPERMLSQSNIFPVEQLEEKYEEKDYEEMRFFLSYFNNNLLHASLFQEGVNMENLKLISLGGIEYLLAFRSPRRGIWMTLGRSANRVRLNRMANILWQFLLKLNRESEVMYVVEHQYFRRPEHFKLTIVLSSWSARMSVSRFQEACRSFILSRLPAHIVADFCWLNVDNMQVFEMAWRKWRQATKVGNRNDAAEAMKVIEKVLKK